MSDYRKLERNPMNKVIGGVCSGLGDYFNLDVALVRVLFVIALFFASFGFWLYIILWIVIPERRLNFDFRAQQSAEEPQHPSDDRREGAENKKTTSVFVGAFIILIGIIFLINNFIPISWVWKLWPLVLVGVGIIMVINAVKKGGSDEQQ